MKLHFSKQGTKIIIKCHVCTLFILQFCKGWRTRYITVLRSGGSETQNFVIKACVTGTSEQWSQIYQFKGFVKCILVTKS